MRPLVAAAVSECGGTTVSGMRVRGKDVPAGFQAGSRHESSGQRKICSRSTCRRSTAAAGATTCRDGRAGSGSVGGSGPVPHGIRPVPHSSGTGRAGPPPFRPGEPGCAAPGRAAGRIPAECPRAEAFGPRDLRQEWRRRLVGATGEFPGAASYDAPPFRISSARRDGCRIRSFVRSGGDGGEQSAGPGRFSSGRSGNAVVPAMASPDDRTVATDCRKGITVGSAIRQPATAD